MARKPNPLKPDDFETIARLRSALRRFQAATDEVTLAHGLTPRQYDLLALLHAPSRGVVVASEIADELCISRNAMTELVSRAERAGLVRRSGDRTDARRKPIAATSAGSRRYRAAVEDLRPSRDRLFELLKEAGESVKTPHSS
jgi:DNA-binding MarR family transcriptional regulator